jgi:hypothetical protein
VDAQIDAFVRGSIDDLALAVRADEEARHFREGRDGGGEADALEPRRHGRQPLHAQGEMRPAFVFRQRMDLIDDQPARVGQQWQPFDLAQQQAEAFRRSEQQMRRLGILPDALVCGSVTAAQLDPDGIFPAEDLAKRPVEILLQIVAERAQRRNVNAMDGVAQLAARMLGHEGVEHSKEGGESFPGAGGGSE